MARKQKDVTLRLSSKGEEELLKALRETGEEGQKMARMIERASKDANRGLKGLDKSSQELQDGFEDLAERAGPVGRILKEMGPAGLAAAAGISALVIGLGAAVRIGKDAATTFASIGNQADRLGLAAETYQALTAEAEQQGIAFTQLETGTRALQERSAQLVQEQGELYTRLKDTNPELLKQLEVLDSNEGRLRAVTKAMAQETTEANRLRIAYAAFGEAGSDVSRVLQAADGDMDKLINKGKELGLVIEDDLIRNSQDLAADMSVASKVLDLQLKQAFIDFAPAALDMIEWLGGIAKGLSDINQGFKEAAERTSEFNARRIDQSQSRLQELGVDSGRLNEARGGGAPITLEDVPERNRRFWQEFYVDLVEFNEAVAVEMQRSMQAGLEDYRRGLAGLTSEELTNEVASIRARIAEDEASNRAEGRPGFVLSNERIELQSQLGVAQSELDQTRAREAATKATKEALAAEEALKREQADADKRRRERLALQRQAAALLAELGDATAALALKEAELTKMVDANFISQAQADEALQIYKDRLTGVTEATQRWISVIEGTRTPLEAVQAQIQQLNADLDAGRLGEGEAAVRLYTDAMEALTKALEEQSPLNQDAEKIRERLAELRREEMTLAEQLYEQETRLNQLVASGNLTREEANSYLEDYRKQLVDVREEVDLWAEAEQVLDGIQHGRIKTIQDVGQAVLDMLVEIIRQQALLQAQMGSQGFGSFLGGIFSFGSSAASTATSSAVHTAVLVGHTGYRVGSGAQTTRSLNQGLMSDEQLIVAQDGEEVVSGHDRDKLVQYIEAAGSQEMAAMQAAPSGAIPLDIHLRISRDGEGAKNADVTAEQTGDNGLDISVAFRDQAREAIAGGSLNSALEAQGFQRNAVTG